MRQNFFPAIRLTIVCIVFFVIIYPFVIWLAAKASTNHGEGETVTVNNKVVGYKLEGQNFSDDKYFWSRPSAVNYNAAGAGGSNKGPTNPDYLKEVQDRIDTFLVHNPGIKKEEIPAELVTAAMIHPDTEGCWQHACWQSSSFRTRRSNRHATSC